MDFAFRIARRLASLFGRVALSAIVIAWRGPRLLFGVVVALIDGVIRAVRFPLKLHAASRDDVVCSRCGERQHLLGRFRCPVCKCIETTHAWARCGVCRTAVPAGYISCSTPGCGEAIRNPILNR